MRNIPYKSTNLITQYENIGQNAILKHSNEKYMAILSNPRQVTLHI